MTGETMLIVDDSDINRAILTELFQANYTIIEATSGEEALEILDACKSNINIVLLDIFMQGINGIEVLSKLRKKEYFSDIPVVMITSSDCAEDQIDAFSVGADDYINKPFIPEIVRARVKSVIESHNRIKAIAKEREQFKVDSELDLMTKLYNKHTVEQLISNGLAKYNNALNAFLIVDIDNFKSVNDNEGHLVGDHTIKIIADLLSSRFRQSDIVGRIGGDEFVVFMANIPNREITRSKAQDLIRLLKFKPNISIPANVTISIGLTFIDHHISDYATVYKQADSALYASKDQGKACLSEYGERTHTNKVIDNKNVVCLITSQRSVYRTVRDTFEDRINLIEAATVEELIKNVEGIKSHIKGIFIDVSDKEDSGVELWNKLHNITILAGSTIVTLYKEGNMEQVATAVSQKTTDLISVPMDESYLLRRSEKWLDLD